MEQQEIIEGDKDMVSEAMAACVLKLSPLIEGKFLKGFTVIFEVDDHEYELKLTPKQ